MEDEQYPFGEAPTEDDVCKNSLSVIIIIIVIQYGVTTSPCCVSSVKMIVLSFNTVVYVIVAMVLFERNAETTP